MKLRSPVFAGSWYANTFAGLRRQIEECFTHKLGPSKLPKVESEGSRDIVGLVCPHAGYIYSGPVAAHAYYELAKDGRPDVIVILSPNHTGHGNALAVMSEGVWHTPLGDVEIDTEIANQILLESHIIDADDEAHAHEHSIELQLPFLQYLFGSSFRFVPISFLIQDLESSREVGIATAKALLGKNALVMASTDMTHYESHERAKKKDKVAIDGILRMDEEQYYSAVESHFISTCGYGPTVATITAVKALSAKKAKLLAYNTSGDITGDFSSVVGYASIAFIK